MWNDKHMCCKETLACTLPARSSGEEEAGRGPEQTGASAAYVRQGLTLPRATAAFIYGAARQQARCALAAGHTLPFPGPVV